MTTSKKITLATVKSFINKNREKLFINVESSFCGMTDGIESQNDGWQPATSDRTQSQNPQDYDKRTLGITGVWFVGGSRDLLSAFENAQFIGFEVYNSCGNFLIGIKK